MNLELYFPTPIWWQFVQNIDIDAIKNLCYRLKEENPFGRQISNQGGWQSIDFWPGTYPELADLEKIILEQANRSVYDYGYDYDNVLVAMGNMWVNINYKGSTNQVHTHDDSFLAGVFYVSARPGQGAINFYKNFNLDYITASQAPIRQYTALSASAMSFQPETGKLIMFPGYVPHGVLQNELDEDRISISFNVRILRKDDAIYWSENLKRNQSPS
jgi:uncharacterized protein (TIGR02466 family)